jgi:hypothetical protein
MGKQKERDKMKGLDLEGPDFGSLEEIIRAGVYWINLAQGGDKWRDLVNTVMSVRVP